MPITPQDLILKLGDLPPLPQVAMKVLRIASDSDTSMEELRHVISRDTALAVQILRIANSPMFGRMREVSTLTQALMTLGFATTKSVVIASSAKNLYCRGNVGLQERLIWEHALSTALGARAFGHELRFPWAEECFLAGLMHDIGRSVMGMKFPEPYAKLISAAYNAGEDLTVAELETFGFDHTMVGEALLQSWNLAGTLVQAVRWHHEPARAPEEHRTLTALVALGNDLALEQGIGIVPPGSLAEATGQAVAILGLDQATLDGHREQVLAALATDTSLVKDF